jgi:hypothetical protein
MKSHSPSSHGHPFTAAAVVGSFALAVAVLLRVAGVFKGTDVSFREWYLERGFGVAAESVQPWWDFLLVLVAVYGLVWFLFETPGMTRRLLVLMTSLVLLLTASPVLALWGTFWSPVGVMLGVAWSGFCAILWARQHPMPCELPAPVVEKVVKGKIVPLTREEEKPEEKGPDKSKSPRRNGSGRGNH